MSEVKPREFWIIDKSLGDGQTLEKNTYLGSSEKPSKKAFEMWPDGFIHVVEYSAYDQLKRERDEDFKIIQHYKACLEIAVEALEWIGSQDFPAEKRNDEEFMHIVIEDCIIPKARETLQKLRGDKC